MKELTDRQYEVLGCIAESLAETGYPPTIREIGEKLQIRSTNGVNDHLKALERKGYIERDDAKSRAVTLTASGWLALGVDGPPPRGTVRRDSQLDPLSEQDDSLDGAVAVPLLGRIAAGMPIDAVEHRENTFVLDGSLVARAGTQEVFALRVRGESMIGDAILDGDVIVVQKQSSARAGEMVAVMVDGAATVKRYYDEGDRIRLQPSNPTMDPIYVRRADARDAVVLGKVLAVYRSL